MTLVRKEISLSKLQDANPSSIDTMSVSSLALAAGISSPKAKLVSKSPNAGEDPTSVLVEFDVEDEETQNPAGGAPPAQPAVLRTKTKSSDAPVKRFFARTKKAPLPVRKNYASLKKANALSLGTPKPTVKDLFNTDKKSVFMSMWTEAGREDLVVPKFNDQSKDIVPGSILPTPLASNGNNQTPMVETDADQAWFDIVRLRSRRHFMRRALGLDAAG